MRLDAYVYTNQGGRDHNEDSASFRTSEDGGIFVVADGLGGHASGEVASACVVDTLLGEWDIPSGVASRREWMERAIADANQAIIDVQEERGGRMKSTVAALAIEGDHAVWANVGDSRVYYIRGGVMASVTADHSVAYKKYIAGEITRADIATDEDQSALLRTVGGRDRNQPDLYESVVPLAPGDGFCLCSDGAWEYLRDEEILIDCLKAGDAKQWCELLLLRVMDRITGGNDNLSILTVLCDDGTVTD